MTTEIEEGKRSEQDVPASSSVGREDRSGTVEGVEVSAAISTRFGLTGCCYYVSDVVILGWMDPWTIREDRDG